MRHTLHIAEIFRNIFGRSSSTTTSTPGGDSHNADLAALARTCKAFKELALDLLWEELDDISPLVRCLPEACCLSDSAQFLDKRCYMFSRPLNEAEWNILRGYARRVRFIRGRKTHVYVEESTVRTIFNLVPFTDLLFPNLRSLYWKYSVAFPAVHAAVPSLTSLHLDPATRDLLEPLSMEFFDAFGDRCPHIEELVVHTLAYGTVDINISRQICRWPNLHEVHCPFVALNMGAIQHLSSIFKLKSLAFTAHPHVIHDLSISGSTLIFPNLVELSIHINFSGFLVTATLLLSHIRLPAIENLSVTFSFSSHDSKRDIQAYWASVRAACLSNILTHMQLQCLTSSPEGPPLQLTLEDLYPCTTFAELREICISLDCSVDLTDAALLELTSPRMEELTINCGRGWKIGPGSGGITLSGLVQLMRKCPSIRRLAIAIDTRTFTKIPVGLDVSFPPREGLIIDFLDSYILPEFVPGLVTVFRTLGLDSSMFTFWNIRFAGSEGMEARFLWQDVQDELGESGEQSFTFLF